MLFRSLFLQIITACSNMVILGMTISCIADDKINDSLVFSSEYKQLEIDEHIFNVSCLETLKKIKVSASSNISWTFDNIPSWITVTPKEGSGEKDVSLLIEKDTVEKRSATLLLKSKDKDWPISLEINISQKSDIENNGYEYVDLGLSVFWATLNVAASCQEDFGGYFAWGETEIKSYYIWNNYAFRSQGEEDDNVMFTKYSTDRLRGIPDKKPLLEPEDDVAHVKWGGDWRIPTKEEFEELMDNNNCLWTWTELNGVDGYIITSRKFGYEGNSIFLPAASEIYDRYKSGAKMGYYWSSSLSGDPIKSWTMFFSSTNHYMVISTRCGGCPIRPVCP